MTTKPTVLLHMGTAKTGSTSLQNSFFENRDFLKAHRVLLPTVDGARMDQRQIHQLLFADPEDDVRQTCEAALLDQVRSGLYDLVVLSSEHIAIEYGRATTALDRLAGMGLVATPILYIREPSAYYLSLQQQLLKHGHRFDSPVGWHAELRKMIESWEAAFGHPLCLVPFDKSQFPEGLAKNFLRRFTSISSDHLTDFVERRDNVSEAPEVTQIMQDYFRANGSVKADTTHRPDIRLRTQMQLLADETYGKRKAHLFDTVRDHILSTHRSDLEWLQKTRNISLFSNAEALAAARPLDDDTQFRDFADIVDVDPSICHELTFKALHRFVANSAKHEHPPKAAQPDSESKAMIGHSAVSNNPLRRIANLFLRNGK